MKEWGLANAHLEAWGPFGRGWSLKSFAAEVSTPQAFPLIAYPKAWSPGTNGIVTSDVILVEAKDEIELEKYKGTLKGLIVLSAPLHEVKAWFDAPGRRKTEKQLLQLADAPDPAKDLAGGPMAMLSDPRTMEFIKAAVLDVKKLKFFYDEGAALVLSPSRSGDGGTIFLEAADLPREIKAEAPMQAMMELFMSRVNAWDQNAPATLPQITLAIEHYNRLVRMVKAGEKVQVRLNLNVQFYSN